MIARLQRFYGGPPDRWLALPMGLVAAYGEQLGKLQAEEQLSAIQAAVAASGNMRKPDLDRYLRQLRRTARGSEKRRAKPATPQTLAGLGIKTERG